MLGEVELMTRQPEPGDNFPLQQRNYEEILESSGSCGLFKQHEISSALSLLLYGK
jgi:hypothetical protein